MIRRFKPKEWIPKVSKWNGYLPVTCPFCNTKVSIVHSDNPYDIVYCWKHGFLKIYSLEGYLEIHPTLMSALGSREAYEFHIKYCLKRGE